MARGGGRVRAAVLRLPVPAALLVGLLIRESFSFWTGHPYDFEVWIRTGAAVARGQNPYSSFWPAVPGASFAFLNTLLPSASYLPPWPVLTGAIFRFWQVDGGGNRFFLYFLLKQPPILGDLAVGALLYRAALRWTRDPDNARALLWLWLLFPYDIVISAIWGQFDALVAVSLLGVVLVESDVQRELLVGVGILLKWVSVVFLPYDALRARGWRRLLPLVALGLAAAVSAAAFVFLHWPFIGIQGTATSQTHGDGGGMNLAGVFTSGFIQPWLGPHAPWLFIWGAYAWVPAAFFAGVWATRRHAAGGAGVELEVTLVIVTAFLLTRWGLYEQYMLFLFPLLMLDIAAFHPERQRLWLALVVLCSGYLVVNNVLGIYFASPAWPSAFSTALTLNASPLFGQVRAALLLAFAILVTVTLVQLVYVVVRRSTEYRLWILGGWLPSRAGGGAAHAA